MEWWINGILGMKSGGVLILISAAGKLSKNRSHSAKPSIPTFHYSSIPWHPIIAKPVISDLN